MKKEINNTIVNVTEIKKSPIIVFAIYFFKFLGIGFISTNIVFFLNEHILNFESRSFSLVLLGLAFLCVGSLIEYHTQGVCIKTVYSILLSVSVSLFVGPILHIHENPFIALALIVCGIFFSFVFIYKLYR